MNLKQLIDLIDRSGITLATEDVPVPSARLNPKTGYKITLPPKTWQLSADVVKAVLLHEFAHVLHGDLLSANVKKDPQAWNIACDARINRDELLPALTEAIQYLVNDDKAVPVVYDRLQRLFPSELPEGHIPPATVIFNAIAQRRKQSPNSRGQLEPHDQLETEGDDLGELKRRHAETVLKARQALRKLADSGIRIPAPLVSVNSDIANVAHRSKRPFDPKPLARIDAVLSRLMGLDGRLQFTRTWTRPRRLGPNTTLRGGAYRPRPKLVVVVDVSGSRIGRLDLSQALVDACRLQFDSEVIVHDTEARWLQPGEPLPEGGGTAFVPAMQLAASAKPDCVVHFTDLQSIDVDQAYSLLSCPTIVAVDGSADDYIRPTGVEIVEVKE